MDGLPATFRLEPGGRAEAPIPALSGYRPVLQRTLRSAISCVGVGLHSGRKVTLTLRPAPEGSGIVVRRGGLGGDNPARWGHRGGTPPWTPLGLARRAGGRGGAGGEGVAGGGGGG